MSGSQPLAPGELHPARRLRRAVLRPRASLRHPLILDGFFRLAKAQRATADGVSACTFYLVFKEPGLLLRLVDRSRTFPPRLSPSGEPSNLTRRFQSLSIPPCVFFLVARHPLQR